MTFTNGFPIISTVHPLVLKETLEDNLEACSVDNENYDNDEYNEEEYNENWYYDNNDPVTIAFFRGEAKGQNTGKAKGKKGDITKGTDGRTVTCYSCGKQGHTSAFCYYNKGKSGKGQNKGQQQSSYWTSSSGTAVWRQYRLDTSNCQKPMATMATTATAVPMMFILTDIHLVLTRHLKDLWSIIIDTGAAVSVCPRTFCEHIEVTTIPESARRQFVTVTGKGLTITGWKEVTLLVGHMSMQLRFIVANVQSALLGLPDIDKNNVSVHV
eukprot:1162668-Amphidinium_carterae.1